MQEWLGLPVQASAHAAELDHMTVLVHWLMVVLFIGWGAFLSSSCSAIAKAPTRARITKARRGRSPKVSRSLSSSSR